MAKWDLTGTIGTYLDRHLVFPLLEFLTSCKVFHPNELLKARYDLSVNTMMWDFSIELWGFLYGGESEIPEAFLQKRAEVVITVKKLTEEFTPIRIALDEAIKSNSVLEQSRDGRALFDHLLKNYDLRPDFMDVVYDYAKSRYSCGDYHNCSQLLYIYQHLVPPTDKNYMNALWGRLAATMLLHDWETALDDFNRLKDYIDNYTFGSALVALQQRTWLIHWSLFIFFNHVKGRDLLIDMFLFQQQYLNVIQTTCPHILRYLTAAVITNKQRGNVMKELVKVLQQESYAYRDPITEFVECLYVNFDFDGAQVKLKECEEILNADFFLISCVKAFMENARLGIFETFCCIHQCISITMLAEKLSMTPEDAEKWIVNLIRNARLDAKIDYQLGHVVMGINTLSPYQQLIEKTKVLTFRAQQMTGNLEKKVAANMPERTPYWASQEF